MKTASLICFLIAYCIVFFFRRYERFVATDLGFNSKLSVEQLGVVSSCVSIGYLLGRFLGGVLSDKVSPIMLFYASVIALCVPVSLTTIIANFLILVLCFFAIGVSSGVVFPSISKLLINTVPRKSFGSYYSLFSGAHGVVGVIIPFIFPLFKWDSWRASLLIFVLSQMILLCFIFLIVKCFDKSLLEDPKHELLSCKEEGIQKNSEKKATLGPKLVVAVLGFVGFANRLGRFSIDWFPIMNSTLFSSRMIAVQQASCMVSCLLSGVISDLVVLLQAKVFPDYPDFANPRTAFLMALVLLNGASYCLLASTVSYVAVFWGNFVFGLVTDSVYNIGGILVVELVERKDSGFTNSFVSIPCQLGCVASGYPVAALAQSE